MNDAVVPSGSSAEADYPDDVATLRLLRRGLGALLMVGMLGTLAELLLIEHTEGYWQLVPVVLLGAGSATMLALWCLREWRRENA